MNIFSLSSAVVSLTINRTVLYMPRATLAFSLMTVVWFQMPPEWTTGEAFAAAQDCGAGRRGGALSADGRGG